MKCHRKLHVDITSHYITLDSVRFWFGSTPISNAKRRRGREKWKRQIDAGPDSFDAE